MVNPHRPTDQAAVEYVVNELEHEIEKLQQKEISRESWPKFLQDEHWKEKTYQRFGVPYTPSKNAVFDVFDTKENDGKIAIKKSLQNNILSEPFDSNHNNIG
jgi:hypothetical protein